MKKDDPRVELEKLEQRLAGCIAQWMDSGQLTNLSDILEFELVWLEIFDAYADWPNRVRTEWGLEIKGKA